MSLFGDEKKKINGICCVTESKYTLKPSVTRNENTDNDQGIKNKVARQYGLIRERFFIRECY